MTRSFFATILVIVFLFFCSILPLSTIAKPSYSGGISCEAKLSPVEQREYLESLVYRILIEEPGQPIVRSGTALAIDKRGYFLTAMHTIAQKDPNTRYYLALHGSEDNDKFEVKPLIINHDFQSLDVTILKIASDMKYRFPSAALHVSRQQHTGNGLFLGIPSNKNTGYNINIFVTHSKPILDDEAPFDAVSDIHKGQSGAIPINESGAAFAVMHRVEYAKNGLVPKHSNEGGRYKTSGVWGNYIARPEVLSMLKQHISLNDVLRSKLEKAKQGTLTDLDMNELKGMVLDATVTSIDLLHLIDEFHSPDLLRHDLRDQLTGYLHSFALQHCMLEEMTKAIDAAQMCINAEKWHERYKKDGKLVDPDLPFNCNSLSARLRTALLSPTLIVRDARHRKWLKAIPADIAAMTGQQALRIHSSRSLSKEKGDYDYLAFANTALTVAAEQFGLSTEEISEKQAKHLSYIFTDLAFALHKEDKAQNREYSANTLNALKNMVKYGGTPSGYNLAAVISQSLGLEVAAFNFDSKALSSFARFSSPQFNDENPVVDNPSNETYKVTVTDWLLEREKSFPTNVTDPEIEFQRRLVLRLTDFWGDIQAVEATQLPIEWSVASADRTAAFPYINLHDKNPWIKSEILTQLSAQGGLPFGKNQNVELVEAQKTLMNLSLKLPIAAEF